MLAVPASAQTCTATDFAGNQSTSQFLVTVGLTLERRDDALPR